MDFQIISNLLIDSFQVVFQPFSKRFRKYKNISFKNYFQNFQIILNAFYENSFHYISKNVFKFFLHSLSPSSKIIINILKYFTKCFQISVFNKSFFFFFKLFWKELEKHFRKSLSIVCLQN